MDKPSLAAAQGEQASDPHQHHTDGYIFTGQGPNVQTPQDTARQEGYSSGFPWNTTDYRSRQPLLGVLAAGRSQVAWSGVGL